MDRDIAVQCLLADDDLLAWPPRRTAELSPADPEPELEAGSDQQDREPEFGDPPAGPNAEEPRAGPNTDD